MKIKININIKINRVVKFLVLSDLLFLGSWSLIAPLFSVFLIRNVEGATLISIGAIAALYWLIKSSLQLPVANYLDKTDGEKDDFYALIIGLFMASLAAFSFALVTKMWEAYIAQFIYAVSMALYIPAWSGIFSRHLDSKRISFDWSLDSAVIGFASFVTALLGGILANWLGFSFVFLVVGTASLLSALFIFFAPNLAFPEKEIDTADGASLVRDHIPSNIGH
ncbi:MAG: MFS transporter [Candidatus Wolfebacteria bacterium]|nr:MFS transporter [Candidatus Wolfebacteria bacterium]